MFSKQLDGGVAAGRPQLSAWILHLILLLSLKKQQIDFSHFQTQFLYIALTEKKS